MSERAVALGAHILDILARPVTHIPEGQGAIILEQVRFAPAGSAAGAAVGLAKLGLPTSSVGAVGDDPSGDLLVRMLGSYGVDTTHCSKSRHPDLHQYSADPPQWRATRSSSSWSQPRILYR